MRVERHSMVTLTHGVRPLQSLLPSPQKGWGASAYPRFQTAEPRAGKVLIQDDNVETDSCAYSAQGLVYLGGPKRHLFSYPNSPSSQAISKIRVRRQISSKFSHLGWR